LNIKIDKNYSLKSDPRNVILVENKTVQDGNNKGTEYESTIGYYGNIEQALNGYLNVKINTSEATSIKELLDEIKGVKEIIKGMLEV
jgi:hypothetical protein